ncbi:MAG TPA: DUF2889 domain-containing protein [Acidimicrobiales bacterium]
MSEAVAAPRPGPQNAVPATPPRVPGSVRRTTSLDMTRPDGLRGRVVADVRGQDVRTRADGAAEVLERLALTVEIDHTTGEVTAVADASGAGDDRAGDRTADPTGDLAALVGVNVRSGFGRRLAELLPDEAERRTLRYSALDDLGGALLVSGYALLHAGALPQSRPQAETVARFQADVCSGWASGAPLLEALRRTGISPLPLGPAAPAIEGDDPHGWHPMAELAPTTVRRRRRLDVIADGATVAARSHFRDSHAADDGETVMHEYEVAAHVGADGRLAGVDVAPRVLPWNECPAAVGSAQRLVGVAVGEIPTRVRRELTGPSTCTHLNSTLRCLADVRALATAAAANF